MTEANTAPLEAEDAAALRREEEAARTAAVVARAKQAHDEAIAALSADHAAMLVKLDALRALIETSLAKASVDRDHLGYASGFVRDVSLKVDDITAWIGRSL